MEANELKGGMTIAYFIAEISRPVFSCAAYLVENYKAERRREEAARYI